jgi:hypothetical protein
MIILSKSCASSPVPEKSVKVVMMIYFEKVVQIFCSDFHLKLMITEAKQQLTGRARHGKT